MKKYIHCVLAVAILSGCPRREQIPRVRQTPRPLPEITAATESPDFVDLAFAIQAVQDRPAETAITAAGLHGGKRVGLRVIVAKGMNPGVTKNSIDRTAFRVGGVRLESTGAESDNFVVALAKLYQVAPRSRMRPVVDFVAFPLQGTPSRIATEHLNLKVFHDPDDKAGEYCELYVHVDIPNGAVRLDEKDPGYRKAVVKAFAYGPPANSP